MPVLEIEKIKPLLEDFLTRLLHSSRLQLKFQIQAQAEIPAESEEPEIKVDFSGLDTDLLLARGGELMDALEEVATRVLRLSIAERAKIVFDSHDFKALRAEELRLTAETAAAMAVKSGAPFALNPMNSHERRLIHLSLKANSAVRTESQGFGSQRKVVIFPAAMK